MSTGITVGEMAVEVVVVMIVVMVARYKEIDLWAAVGVTKVVVVNMVAHQLNLRSMAENVGLALVVVVWFSYLADILGVSMTRYLGQTRPIMPLIDVWQNLV